MSSPLEKHDPLQRVFGAQVDQLAEVYGTPIGLLVATLRHRLRFWEPRGLTRLNGNAGAIHHVYHKAQAGQPIGFSESVQSIFPCRSIQALNQ